MRKGGAVNLLKPQKRPFGEFDILKIFESPVDSLSYAELFPDQREAIYLSFCGGGCTAFLKQMRLIVARTAVKQVDICVDNDDKGKYFAKQIKDTITNVRKFVYWPNLKDWNDDLVNCQRMAECTAFELLREQSADGAPALFW